MSEVPFGNPDRSAQLGETAKEQAQPMQIQLSQPSQPTQPTQPSQLIQTPTQTAVPPTTVQQNVQSAVQQNITPAKPAQTPLSTLVNLPASEAQTTFPNPQIVVGVPSPSAANIPKSQPLAPQLIHALSSTPISTAVRPTFAPTTNPSPGLILNHPSIPIARTVASMDHPMMNPSIVSTLPPNLMPNMTAAMEFAMPSHSAMFNNPLRPLNVKDALSYLDQVKGKFPDLPAVYNKFLEIMKDFKSQAIDTPGVIQRVSSLFKGHPELIIGFNTFLPPGYRIEPTNNPNDPVKVTTPDNQSIMINQGSPTEAVNRPAPPVMPPPPVSAQTPAIPVFFTQPQNVPTQAPVQIPVTPHPPIAVTQPTFQNQQPPLPPAPPAALPSQPQPVGGVNQPNRPVARPVVEFNHAINYVNKIKNRFAGEPETYKQFLEILKTYQEKAKPIQEVYAQVQILFKNATDLLDEFKQFLPENGGSHFRQPTFVLGTMPNGVAVPSPANRQGNAEASGKRPGSINSGPSNAPIPPVKRSKRAAPEKNKETARERIQKKPRASGSSRGEKPGVMEEIEFFDRCKRCINNKPTYTEFLKVINLFSQEIIDLKTLIEKIEPFLSKNPELFDWFKKYVRYESDGVAANTPAARSVAESKGKRIGSSYRTISQKVANSKCSGRDDLSNEVLNNQWMSNSIFQSENGGFLTHIKNVYEESLSRCEDERFEFDMNIDANLHLISLLEPVARKIADMTPDEKQKYKLGPTLCGSSLSIYRTVLKKIYGEDRYEEVMNYMRDSPAATIPVVLKRLKKKDEEWKGLQRDWNKVWREIVDASHYKALDHQGINFKQNEKRTLSTKQLQHEIEVLYQEQRHPANGQSPVQHQMEFYFKDPSVFRDVQRLIFGMLDSTQLDDDALVRYLKVFLPNFFWTDFSDIGPEFDDDNDGGTYKLRSETVSEGEPKKGPGRGSNLRKSALRKNNGKSKRKTNGGDSMEVDEESVDEGSSQNETQESASVQETEIKVENNSNEPQEASYPPRAKYSFYGTSHMYYFFRLYQMAFARLSKMKELSKELADRPPVSERLNPVAVQLGLVKKPTDEVSTTRNRYEALLNLIEEFFENKINSDEFEEKARVLFSTSAYLVFTIDKLIGGVIKQITHIISDENRERMLKLYFVDRATPTSTARQEAAYRISAENLALGEAVFRLEYNKFDRALTIQAVGKEESNNDSAISAEEKWSMYVDYFVQIYPSDGPRLKRREPFLRRNFPEKLPQEPAGNLETRSGLELKICVNTYKIHFVEHTEDFFRRKYPNSVIQLASPDGKFDSSLLDGAEKQVIQNQAKLRAASEKKFKSWIGKSWRRDMKDEAAKNKLGNLNAWLLGSGSNAMRVVEVNNGNRRLEIDDLFAGQEEKDWTEEAEDDAVMTLANAAARASSEGALEKEPSSTQESVQGSVQDESVRETESEEMDVDG